MKMVNNKQKLENSACIGALLLKAGKISASDAERIITLQEKNDIRFGDAAKALGLISDDDIQSALSCQFDFPYLTPDEEDFSQELVAAYQPFSAYVDALRVVRNQLLLRWFSAHKALAVVSPGREEGRSFLAANLAVVFSQLGKRTLLIDADFRHSRQQKLFKIKCNFGLSDLLAERSSLDVIYQKTNFRDLSVLISGTMPPNPIELLSRGFNKLLKELQSQYDVIIIDTPAFVDGIDFQLISAQSGGALLVARQHITRLNDMQQLKDALLETGSQCVGTVIGNF